MRKILLQILGIFVLCCLALAYPIFQVLGNGPEFFVNRRSESADILITAFVLLILIPAVPACLALLISTFSKKAASLFLHLLTALFFLLYLLSLFCKALNNLSPVPCYFALATLLLCSLGLTLVNAKFSGFRSFLAFLSPIILIAPLSFFLGHGIRNIVFPQTIETWIGSYSTKTPVVVVIFDEFSLNSLLDENQNIDANRFPNFAQFASNSYWFKNATAVNQFTPIAVPAILSGNLPTNAEALPTSDSHPRNLFTLFGSSHEMHVYEPFTKLCPDTLCKPSEDRPDLSARLTLILQDILAVYLNIIVPSPLGYELPDITAKWGDFWGEGQSLWTPPNFSRDSRVNFFNSFIDSLTKGSKPGLYFFHQLLPHMPYQFSSSGKLYEVRGNGAYVSDKWVKDPNMIQFAYRQYLLQIAATDALLGRLMDKLKSIGVYDEAVIVVAADHGVSFQPGTYRRGHPKHPSFYEDVLSVPLFIKLPQQKEGVISNRQVETIDIVPSIADAIKIRLPWALDGKSAFDEKTPERTEKKVYVGNVRPSEQKATNWGKELNGQVLSFTPANSFPHKTLDWKLSLPGYQNPNPIDPYYVGPHQPLLGQDISNFKTMALDKAVFTLTNRSGLSNDKKSMAVDFNSHTLACRVIGKFENAEENTGEIALAINGKLAGFALIKKKSSKGNFDFIVSEKLLIPGDNRVALFFIKDDSDGNIVLSQLRQQGPPA